MTGPVTPPDGVKNTSGATIWLTGLPSAGKTTLARGLRDALAATGHRAEVLDGDELRAGLCSDLGFSREDRHTNAVRIGFVAQLLAQHDVKVLVPVIAPYAASRAEVRRCHDRLGLTFLEVYVDTSLDTCRSRDVKGLYARHADGGLTGLTGVDDPYEAPGDPDLWIKTEGRSVADCVRELSDFLISESVI